MSSGTNTKSRWGVHPGVAYYQAGLANLKTRTGYTMEEWVALVRIEGPKGDKERRDWLQKAHKLSQPVAWQVVEWATNGPDPEATEEGYLTAADSYVREMFAPKPALVPMFEKLLELGLSLGDDVKACPCKTIVPLYRNHVFAEIKPSTKTRIDLGFCLRGVEPAGRLVSTGGEAKGNRITHKIGITGVGEIDAEVKKWMKKAYDGDK